MARIVATSMAMAAIALLSACGGGSSTSGSSASTVTNSSTATGTTPTGGVGQPVSAKNGDFRTVIPKGYSNGIATAVGKTTSVEYVAIGPRVGGFASHVTVFREPASGGDIHAVASRALRQLGQRPSFLPKVRGLSSLRALKVDEAPALAVNYLTTGRKSTRHDQIFVIHGQWVYEISDVALPARYAASLVALDDVISSWHWQ